MTTIAEQSEDEILSILKKTDGGRVLDIATGGGMFAGFLAEHLRSVGEVTGLDMHEPPAESSDSVFNNDGFTYCRGDAHSLDFTDDTFDTVAICNSLHHLNDHELVLREMLRVLRPGGLFVLMEMVRDEQTDAQMTHVRVHHWAAGIDMVAGVSHHETMTRVELLNRVANMRLSQTSMYYQEPEGDPLDPDTLTQMEAQIDAIAGRGTGIIPDDQLLREASEIRSHLHRSGFHLATEAFIAGRKPS
jgi:ubiquinone/menaquinone biosynthesis C-methylase UbiE